MSEVSENQAGENAGVRSKAVMAGGLKLLLRLLFFAFLSSLVGIIVALAIGVDISTYLKAGLLFMAVIILFVQALLIVNVAWEAPSRNEAVSRVFPDLVICVAMPLFFVSFLCGLI